MTCTESLQDAPASRPDIAAPFWDEAPVFTFVLVKLASRCNINCTYCYWFRDAEVYRKPAVLTAEAEDAFAGGSKSTFEDLVSTGFRAGVSWRRTAAVPEAQVRRASG